MAKPTGSTMGPVNWRAVLVAAALAAALRLAWYPPLLRRRTWPGLVLPLLVAAAMLGHMFARASPGKPWLYFMMSGGLAAAFIVPALWLAQWQREVPGRETAREAAYWLVAYLAMGAVFWAFA